MLPHCRFEGSLIDVEVHVIYVRCPFAISPVCILFLTYMHVYVFQDTQEKEAVVPERAEEAKLKAKYPNLGLQKPGGSDFLMKRLQKGVTCTVIYF